MTTSHSPNRLPAAALRAFEIASQADWQDGVSLTELLERVNRVTESFLPPHGGPGSGSGRVKKILTECSFRHYQTLGCINPPIKNGRLCSYDFSHFVRALQVRRLLWERVSADQIAGMMSGRSTDEIVQMFRGGVEVVLRRPEAEGEGPQSSSQPVAEVWTRLPVLPGVELHLRDDIHDLRSAELSHLLKRIEEVLQPYQR